MCGLTGFWNPDLNNKDDVMAIGQAMTDTLSNRGPDSSGTWHNRAQGIFLGHRRLAIQDLSPAGHQPMHSQCGRYILVYNGEVYNSADLRAELVHHSWAGHSDTEVILQACIQWGVNETVRKLNGMFAFALYDQHGKHLHLVRDRIGVKPFYWGIHQKTLIFGSELKACVKHPKFVKEISQQALRDYFQQGYIVAPLSIWQNTYKLRPGTYLKIDANLSFEETLYWDLDGVISHSQNNIIPHYIDYENQVESLLEDAIQRQLITDVPLGTLLSGGVDSTLVTALAQKNASSAMRTFTVGFHDAVYNEAPYAQAIATHLGTDHHELYVTPQQTQDIIPDLATIYDEPFADASQIPTYLLSKLARSHVTVALSGDGGDELFAGYNRYYYAGRNWQIINAIPLSVRRTIAPILTIIPHSLWSIFFKIFFSTYRISHLPSRIQYVANLLQQSDLYGFYQQIIGLWPLDQNPVPLSNTQNFMDDHHSDNGFTDHSLALNGLPYDAVSTLQINDLKAYLPDNVLHKVDRASMAASLEVRVPLLDHRLVELSWRAPPHYKITKHMTKKPLREILYRHVPRQLIERPKMGFSVPIASWLRTDLKSWATDLLQSGHSRNNPVLNFDLINTRWQQHQDGQFDWSTSLWCVLMFQAWKRKWMD